MPTSAEINTAIETLRTAGAHPPTMHDLQRWNVARLREAAKTVTSHEDLERLFAGISPHILAEAGVV